MRILIIFLLLFLNSQHLIAQHSNELYNDGALISVQNGAEIHVKGDVHMIGGSLENNGLILTQGNSYSDNTFQQLGTGTYRIENSVTNAGERQFIQGSFAVRGGQSKIGTDDGSFYDLELANDQGVVYLVSDANSEVVSSATQNLVADVRKTVNLYPTGSPLRNTIITHDVGLTGTISPPANGSNYSSVFGLMSVPASSNNMLGNTITVNGNMSGADAGYVQGKLRRAISSTGGIYDFVLGLEPAATNAQRGVQYSRMDFDANDYDVVTGYFQSGSSNTGSSVIECAGNLVNYWGGTNHGEWIFEDISGVGSGTYDMTVWPQDANFITSSIWIISKNNAISGTANGCGPSPVGLSRYGFDGFSEFGLAAVISALPAELIGIDARGELDHIDVNWTTATENNVSHFELERSIDGESFNYISSLDASGNSLSLLNYQYNDYGVRNSEMYYYRIKTVDFDGFSEYSQIVSAQVNKEQVGFSTDAIFVYPNPGVDVFSVSISSSVKRFLVLRTLNNLGQVISSQELNIVAGNTIVNITSEEWASGSYALEISDISSGERISKRIIKN